MLTWVAVATGEVFTVKVALLLPAGTVTLPGTVAAAGVPLCSVTTAPPAGAAPVSVTVPVEEAPPTTVAGFRLTEDSPGELTVSVACALPL